MTVDEAEQYYKAYLGHGFHMCREEPGRYQRFRQLKLSESTYAQWDCDLLDSEFEKLWKTPDRVWVHQGNILDILARGRCRTETGTARLLDEMDRMGTLSLGCRTLIIENMSGRTQSLEDGGVCFFCRKTKQRDRMMQVMTKLTDPRSGSDRRFTEAVQRYETALRKFGRV